MIAKIRHFSLSSETFTMPLFILRLIMPFLIRVVQHLEPVKASMRKAVRLMAFQQRDAHSEPLFQQFNILNFDDSYRLEIAKFINDISHNKLQQSFQTMLSLVKERHNRVTRQATDQQIFSSLCSNQLW